MAGATTFLLAALWMALGGALQEYSKYMVGQLTSSCVYVFLQ